MITDLLPLMADGPMLLAEGGDEGGGGILAILAAGPVSGVLVYMGIYSRYRNKDKRYRFESEAKVDVGNMMVHDQKVNHRRRVTGRRMDGGNESEHLQRVQQMRLEG
ncbi:hypothetical protein [Brachybacterium hainanense]|uniref:Uncharacterized protein n=1 Tax=Brachybacterium hainanense TaxID=1541174 RepID=A0ABV6REC0_9MICO